MVTDTVTVTDSVMVTVMDIINRSAQTCSWIWRETLQHVTLGRAIRPHLARRLGAQHVVVTPVPALRLDTVAFTHRPERVRHARKVTRRPLVGASEYLPAGQRKHLSNSGLLGERTRLKPRSRMNTRMRPCQSCTHIEPSSAGSRWLPLHTARGGREN